MSVVGTAKSYARRADRRLQLELARSFERRMGIDTVGAEGLTDFGVEGPDRVYHAASPTITLRRALKRLDPGPDDVFVDVGSGKGQALLAAAQLPYGRVIGVELADQMTQVAKRNVERVRPKLTCQNIELLTADALEWEIPSDLTLVYMYCPFLGSTFDAFIDRVVASHDANPRPMHVVYAYPFEHNRLVRRDRFHTVDVNSLNWPTRPGWWDNDKMIVSYKLLADGESPPAANTSGYRQSEALELWSRPNDIRFELHPPDGEAIYSEPA